MSNSKFLLILISLFFLTGIVSAVHPSKNQNHATKHTVNNAKSNTTDNTNKKRIRVQLIDDAAITAKIKSDLLQNQRLGSLTVSVATDKGVVTLNGKVENAEQKDEVVKVTSEVAGVKSVIDQLKIGKI